MGGKLHKHKAGKNEKVATRLKSKLQVQEDEGTFEALKNIKFEKWADQWTGSLERKSTTVRSYETTMNFAKNAFGSKNVRAVSLEDVSALNASMREADKSESTRGKHLRVLHACFASAMAHDYTAMNPVKKLPKSEKPSVVHREAAYFTNEELPRLFAAIPYGPYRVFFGDGSEDRDARRRSSTGPEAGAASAMRAGRPGRPTTLPGTWSHGLLDEVTLDECEQQSDSRQHDEDSDAEHDQ